MHNPVFIVHPDKSAGEIQLNPGLAPHRLAVEARPASGTVYDFSQSSDDLLESFNGWQRSPSNMNMDIFNFGVFPRRSEGSEKYYLAYQIQIFQNSDSQKVQAAVSVFTEPTMRPIELLCEVGQ